MEPNDPTGDRPSQHDGPLGDSFLVGYASRARHISHEFGWPVLLLYLVGPGAMPGPVAAILPFYLLLSLPAMLSGLWLRLWSKGYYRRDGFIIDGPYRYVRNPVELGALLVYAGGGILMALPWWYIL